jgi:exoribonuclease R
MLASSFDLKKSAREEMIHEGFDPDWSPEALAQAKALSADSAAQADNGVSDLRNLLWSSIDNDSSRDLDQIEFAERTPAGIRVLVGIADVDAYLPIASPMDRHAAAQTTTVCTPLSLSSRCCWKGSQQI